MMTLHELVSSILIYKLSCAYSEDSNQSAHPCSLPIVLVFHLQDCWTFGYLYSAYQRLVCLNLSKYGGKYQESIQSSTTNEPGHYTRKWQSTIKTSHTREPRGQPFPSKWPKDCIEPSRNHDKNETQITKHDPQKKHRLDNSLLEIGRNGSWNYMGSLWIRLLTMLWLLETCTTLTPWSKFLVLPERMSIICLMWCRW